MIRITVTDVTAAEGTGKGRFLITVHLASGEHEEEKTFLVFRYFIKEPPFSGVLPEKGDTMSAERYDALERASEATKASVKAVELLAYGDQTAKRLTEKLRRKGFSADAAADAVRFMTEKRYIREEEQLSRLMEQLCEKKKYGIRRIREEVYLKGFSEDAISAVWEDTLETLDFDAALDSRMRKLGTAAWETPEKQKKTYASLLRYGFTHEEITRARKRFSASESN